MECAQALAFAAAAVVVAGQPLHAPLAEAHALVTEAVAESSAMAHEAACAAETALKAALAKAAAVHVAQAEFGTGANIRQRIPDARIHAAAHRPI